MATCLQWRLNNNIWGREEPDQGVTDKAAFRRTAIWNIISGLLLNFGVVVFYLYLGTLFYILPFVGYFS